MKNRHILNFVLVTLLSIAVLTVDIPFVRGTIEWSSETQLTTDPDRDISPAIMQAANGTIWVVWASNRKGYMNDKLFYTTSSNYGLNWSSPKNLTTASGYDSGPSIMQTVNGTIWVAWASTRTENYEIFYKTSDDGSAWSVDEQLTNETHRDISPSIMQASNGTIWVVWSSNRNGNYEIFYKTSDDGSAWSVDEQLTIDPSDDEFPSIVQLSNGTIWVVWSSYRNGDYGLFYKTFNGSVWSCNDNPLTVDSDFYEAPSIAQARDGTIWVVWQSGEPLADLYYKFYNGSAWSSDMQLTYDSAANDIHSSIVQINDRKMWVVWATDKDENFNIYYKTTVVIPGDVNGDKTVDITDLAMIGEAYGKVEEDPDYNPVPDLNCDGVIDIYDLAECGRNYG